MRKPGSVTNFLSFTPIVRWTCYDSVVRCVFPDENFDVAVLVPNFYAPQNNFVRAYIVFTLCVHTSCTSGFGFRQLTLTVEGINLNFL
jgi:hypothetical protein